MNSLAFGGSGLFYKLDLFALALPRFGRGELGFDGLGFVSPDPVMMYVNDAEGMEVRMRCRKDEDEDEGEELREKEVERV